MTVEGSWDIVCAQMCFLLISCLHGNSSEQENVLLRQDVEAYRELSEGCLGESKLVKYKFCQKI